MVGIFLLFLELVFLLGLDCMEIKKKKIRYGIKLVKKYWILHFRRAHLLQNLKILKTWKPQLENFDFQDINEADGPFKKQPNIQGLYVTIPYKVAVDSICLSALRHSRFKKSRSEITIKILL